jgi:nucleoid DNA-binding protein
VTKREFVRLIAERVGLSQREAARAVDAILESIMEALRDGDEVSLTGFGKFLAASRAARMGVNPRNPSEKVRVPPSRAPAFRAGTGLRQAVAGYASAANGGRGRADPQLPKLRLKPGAGAGSRTSFSGAERGIPGRLSPSGKRLETRSKARGRARPPRRPRTTRHAPPRQSSRRRRGEKYVNAWVSGRGAQRTAPLRVGETYALNINVGERRDLNLAQGETTIDTSAFPPEGLDTEWLLSAPGIELQSPPGRDIEIVAGNEQEPWTASFKLHIPKDADSETSVLAVTPRRADAGHIDAIVLAGGEVYRRLSIVLSVRRPGAAPPVRKAALVQDDTIETPARYTHLRTLHEWTTPPGRLSILVQPSYAIVRGSAGTLDIDDRVAWTAVSAYISAPIRRVRSAAEAFRSAWQDYLNDIDPRDLLGRLREPIAGYGAMTESADEQHERAWRAARRSPELRELASAGRSLYDAVFQPGSDLRKWLDLLRPGHRVDISWQNRDPGWVPGVPWGLMYAGNPNRAVDPMEFLALKLRIGYWSHAVKEGSKALGAPDAVNRGNLLYWRSGKDDDLTAREAEWQRREFSPWGKQLFWPIDASAKNPKKEIVRALTRPTPRPVGVLYLYCQSSFGTDTDGPLLTFSDPARAAGVASSELGIAQLADRPLVFANACTTAAGEPYESNPLEDVFFQRGCRAFLGTEIRVPIQLASRFARVFFEFFYRRTAPEPLAAGEAVGQTRLFLWHHYRNLGGLFYAYVNQYELFLADDDEVAAMHA